MIIDIHAHIAYHKLYPDDFIYGMAGDLIDSIEERTGGQVDDLKRKQAGRLFSAFLKDKECSQFIHQLDTAGISKAVLLIIDGGICFGESALSLEEIYEHYRQVLNLYPDRFVVFGGVDPRRGRRGVELFKKGIESFGFRGLKLYPPMGFSMNDPRLDPCYQLCQENGLPVLIHTGPSLPGMQNHFADPLHALRLAKKYPGLNIILAHAGYALYSEVVKELIKLPNIYVDLAGFQTLFRSVNEDMKQKMGGIFSKSISRKVLFGTDWPLFNLLSPITNHVELLKELFHSMGSQADEESLENILWRNAEGLLKTNVAKSSA